MRYRNVPILFMYLWHFLFLFQCGLFWSFHFETDSLILKFSDFCITQYFNKLFTLKIFEQRRTTKHRKSTFLELFNIDFIRLILSSWILYFLEQHFTETAISHGIAISYLEKKHRRSQNNDNVGYCTRFKYIVTRDNKS